MKVLWLWCFSISLAAAANAQKRVSLDALVEQALAANPEIAAAQKRFEAAHARIPQERSLPDPMISAGYSSIGNPLPGAGLGSEPLANLRIMASQAIPFPGKLALRSAIAGREADAEAQLIAAARVRVTSRVKQAYYRLAYAYAVSDVLTRNQELLDTLLRVSEGRYAVGHAAQQDVIKAQTELSILALRQERVRQERTARTGELNALLDRAAATPIGRPDDLALVAFDHAFEPLLQLAVAHAPMLRRDQIMIDRSQLGVEAARKEYRPDFAVSAGYAYMGAMPPMYEVRFDVNVPLQRERRAAAVVEQIHSVEAAKREYDGNRLAVQARLQEDYEMAATSLRLARLYRDTVLPQARLALESSMASYQTGRVDFLSVLTNFGSVLEFEVSYFEELTSFHVAASRIEEMTGAPVAH